MIDKHEEEVKKIKTVVGYGIIVLTIVVFGVATIKTLDYFFMGRKYITVYFPRIGELAVEQPLLMNGVKIGEIADFNVNVYDGVAVRMKIFRNIKIRRHYQFYSEDIGLFGYSRRVIFINGPKNEPLVASNRRLKGSYYAGLPEIIVSIDKLDRGVTYLSYQLKEFIEGKNNSLDIFNKLKELNQKSDHILEILANLQNSVDNFNNKTIKYISSLANNSKDKSRKLDNFISDNTESIDNKITTLSNLVDTIPHYLNELDTLISKINNIDSSSLPQDIIDKANSLGLEFDTIKEDEHHLRIILKKYNDNKE